MIAEIMFYTHGFSTGKECAHKMVQILKLCAEQLSPQCHYDYGMRAVKSIVVRVSQVLRQQEPHASADEEQESEMALLCRVMYEVMITKLTEADRASFEEVMADLFDGEWTQLKRQQQGKTGEASFGDVVRECASEFGLQPHEVYVQKVQQVVENLGVRHSIMAVGAAGSGKSTILATAAATIQRLHSLTIRAGTTGRVEWVTINPKAMPVGEMYGQFNRLTDEWSDGVLSTVFRDMANNPSGQDSLGENGHSGNGSSKLFKVKGGEAKASGNSSVPSPTPLAYRWIVFDGPVDAVWVENMNTVMDDNKKLCLMSGEIISMSSDMRMIFETQDLRVASPAT
jgi:dynein heavy chain